MGSVFHRVLVVALALVVVITLAVLVVTRFEIAHACSPGPKPSSWSAAEYSQYAATACQGVQ